MRKLTDQEIQETIDIIQTGLDPNSTACIYVVNILRRQMSQHQASVNGTQKVTVTATFTKDVYVDFDFSTTKPQLFNKADEIMRKLIIEMCKNHLTDNALVDYTLND